MNIGLNQIRAFVTVAELGSFTRAAGFLNLSQPALTVQIRKFEEALGVRLFDRNTRTVAITRVGQDLVPALQRILRDLDTVIGDTRDLGAHRHGTVRIAALPSFASSVLPEIIATFRKANPKIAFEIHDTIASGVIAQVHDGQVDFGITGGSILGPEIQVLHRAQDRMQVVFPRGHPLGRSRRIDVNTLAPHPLILMDPATSVRAIVDAAFLAADRQPTIAAEVTYMSTAVGLVRAGLGIAILPESVTDARAERSLCARPVDDPDFMREISVVKRANRTIPPSGELFLATLIHCLAAAALEGRQCAYPDPEGPG